MERQRYQAQLRNLDKRLSEQSEEFDDKFTYVHRELMRIKKRFNKLHGTCGISPDAEGCDENHLQQGGFLKKLFRRSNKSRKKSIANTKKLIEKCVAEGIPEAICRNKVAYGEYKGGRRRKRTKKKTRKRRRKSKRRKGGASQKRKNINHKKIVGNNARQNNTPAPILQTTNRGMQIGQEVILVDLVEPFNVGIIRSIDFPHYTIEMQYPSDEGEITVTANEVVLAA